MIEMPSRPTPLRVESAVAVTAAFTKLTVAKPRAFEVLSSRGRYRKSYSSAKFSSSSSQSCFTSGALGAAEARVLCRVRQALPLSTHSRGCNLSDFGPAEVWTHGTESSFCCSNQDREQPSHYCAHVAAVGCRPGTRPPGQRRILLGESCQLQCTAAESLGRHSLTAHLDVLRTNGKSAKACSQIPLCRLPTSATRSRQQMSRTR